MYLNLTELKIRLWITDNTQDTTLGYLLDDSRAMLTTMGLDYTKQSRVKVVDTCDLHNLYLDCPEVDSIDEINNISYTGVKGTDYVVLSPSNALVHFCNLNYTDLNNCGCKAIVKYTAGYDPIPSDLKLLQFYIVLALQLEMKSMQNAFSTGSACQKVQKIKMWPREITYVEDWQGLKNAMSMYEWLQSKIDNLLNIYKLHVI